MQIKKVFIVLLMCICLVGCSSKTSNPITPSEPELKPVNYNSDLQNDTAKFIKEYKSLNSYIEVNIPSNAFIHYGSSSEILELLTSGTGIIYFGRPSCPWCRNVIPVLAEVAVNNSMVINYYNPGEVQADESDIYLQIKEKISEFLYKDENNNPVIYLPDIYFVKNGKVIGHKLGSASTQDDAYTPLTNEQKQELVDIYQKYIDELKK